MKNYLIKFGKVICWFLLFLASSFILVSITEAWFPMRFMHAFQWDLYDYSQPNPIVVFFRKRMLLDWDQEIYYFLFLLLIVLLNFGFIVMKTRKARKNGLSSFTFLNKYFLYILFAIINFRFWGDTTNSHIDKEGWYYIFIAIPTYIQLCFFCLTFSLFIKYDKLATFPKVIYSLPHRFVGKSLIFLSITYLIYYILGNVLAYKFCNYINSDDVSVYSCYFYTWEENIRSILVKCCFSNWLVALFNCGTICTSFVFYTLLMRTFKAKSRTSELNAFLFLVKTFLFLLIIASSVRFFQTTVVRLLPDNLQDMITMSLYYLLMIVCILFFIQINKIVKSRKCPQSEP